MRRSHWSLALSGSLGLAALLIGSPVMAGPLKVEVQDGDGHSRVRIVDADGQIADTEIKSSRRGLMLTFSDETIDSGRLDSKAERLEYVQAAQYGNNAVVRLSQRANLRGGIKGHTKVSRHDGTIELVVYDKAIPAAAEKSTPSPSAAAPDLAQLNAKLGPAPDEAVASDQAPPTEVAAEDNGDELIIEDEAAVQQVEPVVEEPWPSVAPASSESNALTDSSPENPALWTIGGTAAVALALVPLALWLRRRNGLSWATAQRLEVLAKTSLGPKQHVVCIRVDNRELLIGVTEHQVRLIADLSQPPRSPSADAPLTTAQTSAPQTPDPARAAQRLDAFKSRLADALTAQGQNAPQTSWSEKSSGVIELERILSRRPSPGSSTGADPNWTTDREVV